MAMNLPKGSNFVITFSHENVGQGVKLVKNWEHVLLFAYIVLSGIRSN